MSPAGGSGPEVRILAPAKINLVLAVLGRRPDGYHELRTIFQAITLSDRLTLRRMRRGVRVACPALAALGEENLAHRAAVLFLRKSGAAGGLAIDLEKRIPTGGGLGGGSSDAAAVLLGACRLWGMQPPRGELEAWAAALGSDVPFFIGGGSAVGSGRGESIAPIDPWPGEAAVVIYAPEEGLSTQRVYARLSGALTSRERAFTILTARWRQGDLRRLGAALFNDLETPAFQLAPGLAGARQALLDAGAAGAALSGSGSCLFGLFSGGADAERAIRELRTLLPGRFFRARFLGMRKRWGVVKR